MLETIIGKRVRVLWTNQSGGTPGEFFVKGFDPALQWICIQSINENGALMGHPSWTRLADIDQVEVLEENYNPSLPAVVQQKPAAPSGTHEASSTRATLIFDFPAAERDFYIATHAPNAFSALISIGERLKKDEKNPKKYVSSAVALKDLHSFFKEVIEKAGVKIRY